MSAAIENSVNGVKHTFSSWDSCMSKAYCKWPVIVGIIVGALILFSVLYCVIQILCCGAQCCFCFASMARCLCCGCCRGSGRGNRGGKDYDPGVKNNGYVRPADYNTSYQPSYMAQPQYASHVQPQYGPPATATFDTPSKNARHANEDALPAMPSWSDAQSRRVETHGNPEHDDVEMGKLNHAGQSEPMLPKFESDEYKYARGDSAHGMNNTTGDIGLGAGALAANGYRDNYGRQEGYEPMRGTSPAAGYRPQQQGQQYNQAYDNRSYASQAPNQSFAQHDSPYGNYDHTPSTTAVGTAYTGAQPHSPTRGPQPQAYPSQRTQSPTYAQAPAQQSYTSQSPTRPQPQQQQHSYTAPSPAYPAPAQQPQQQQQTGYAAYPGRATYQAAAEPVSSSTQGYAPSVDTARKPVQGSWRDV